MPPSLSTGSKYQRRFLTTTVGLPLHHFRKRDLWRLPRSMFRGGWIATAQYWKVASRPALGLCCPTQLLRAGGCGKCMAEEHSSSCRTGKWSGATTRGGGKSNTSKEHWITMSRTCGEVVDCPEPAAVTDWSAMPQRETEWLFLSEGIGPKETKRQTAAAAPIKGESL